jgi:D-arabinose 1-dehydrogenase-like Zn-dependent alcohol dehydrogenase
MVLERPGQPLRLVQRPVPVPSTSQVLVRVAACGVCRTDLHVVDGELPDPRLPIVPGHEIVGTVEEAGGNVHDFAPGDRVGIPWLAYTCGRCAYCTSGRENLCASARFTGYTVDGGYADYTLADARYCFRMPAGPPDRELAPWLCAGLSATAHCVPQATLAASAYTASAPPRTSSRKSRVISTATSSRSRGRVTHRRRRRRLHSAAHGRVAATSPRRGPSMPR